MAKTLIVAGGGIGGLAAALACSRAGWGVELLEQSAAFGEVGAGVQLGPNVVRLLNGWGLADALAAVAACPQELQVRSAIGGDVLGVLPLGRRALRLYGAQYLTMARADLHGLLLRAVEQCADVALHLESRVAKIESEGSSVAVRDTQGRTFTADALLGADGLWSRVRQAVVNDAPPRFTGHLAYRALVHQSDLPAALRSQVVTAWMGPKFHAVQYPVKRGEWLNVVVIVQGKLSGDLQHWDHQANAADLRRHMGAACQPIRDLVGAIADWRLWPLCDRAPMQSALEHARGRIALLGDAAHPMRPYLAQGAGMAIEDACVLAQSLASTGDVVQALQHYADVRWQRNARVQARAIRNGEIFHMQGLMRSGRDMSLKLLGARLLDVPWLYRGLQ